MTQACAPPQHWWDITTVTRLSIGYDVHVSCTCGETRARAERTVGGWAATLVEPVSGPLFSRDVRDIQPLGANDQLVIGAKISLAGEAPAGATGSADPAGAPSGPDL